MSTETSAIPTTPAAPAVAATPPATPPAAAPQPQTVTIPLEQLQTFTSVQARLAQLEAEQRQRDESARAEQVKLMAAKGEIENALRLQREEAQKQLDTERSSRAAVEELAQSGMRSMVRFREYSRASRLYLAAPNSSLSFGEISSLSSQPATVSRSVHRPFKRSETSCRPNSPDRSTRISSALRTLAAELPAQRAPTRSRRRRRQTSRPRRNPRHSAKRSSCRCRRFKKVNQSIRV